MKAKPADRKACSLRPTYIHVIVMYQLNMFRAHTFWFILMRVEIHWRLHSSAPCIGRKAHGVPMMVAFLDRLSLLFIAEKDHDAAAVSVEIREGELHAIVCTEDYPTVALPASTDVITARNEPYVETRGKASASFQPLRAEDTAGYSSIEHQAITGARVGDAVGKHL
jgi:hypothetical protein